MDYSEWAREYFLNAQRVKSVIDKKVSRLNDKGLTADDKKQLNSDIKEYRRIFYELSRVGEILRDRAGKVKGEA